MKQRFLKFLFVVALLLWLATIGAYVHSRNRNGGVWAAVGGWSVMISWTNQGPMLFAFADWPKNLDFGWVSASTDQFIPGMEAHGPLAAFDPYPRYWDFMPESGRVFVQPGPIDHGPTQIVNSGNTSGRAYRAVAGPVVPQSSAALVRMWGLFILNWWLPLLSVAILPASVLLVILYRIRRRNFRMRNKLCLSCGYDLRSTPERCPECGTIPS